MGAALFLLASVGLIGGFGLIAAGNKKIKPITFPNSFYENLEYFKLDGKSVIAMKYEGDNEIVFEGSTVTATKYFAQVQLGFENWLEKNDHASKGDTGGSVKF